MNNGIHNLTATTLLPPFPGLSVGNLSIPTAISPAFSPMSVAGCRLWLDADDPYSLTLSGSSVVNWRDKSQSGLDVGYTVLANQPIYTRQYKNGRGAITFGTGAVMSVLRSAAPPVQGMTAWPMGDLSMFIVYEVLTRVTSCRLMGITYSPRGTLPITATAITGGFQLNAISGGLDSPLATAEYSVVSVNQNLTIGSPHPSYEASAFPALTPTGCINYVSAVIPRGNSEADYLRNAARGGEAEAFLRRNGRPGSRDRNYNSFALQSSVMATRLQLGANSAGAEVPATAGGFFRGNVYEVAVFNRLTTKGETLALEEYFRQKWCPNQPPVYLQN